MKPGFLVSLSCATHPFSFPYKPHFCFCFDSIQMSIMQFCNLKMAFLNFICPKCAVLALFIIFCYLTKFWKHFSASNYIIVSDMYFRPSRRRYMQYSRSISFQKHTSISLQDLFFIQKLVIFVVHYFRFTLLYCRGFKVALSFGNEICCKPLTGMHNNSGKAIFDRTDIKNEKYILVSANNCSIFLKTNFF